MNAPKMNINASFWMKAFLEKPPWPEDRIRLLIIDCQLFILLKYGYSSWPTISNLQYPIT